MKGKQTIERVRERDGERRQRNMRIYIYEIKSTVRQKFIGSLLWKLPPTNNI